MKKIILSVIAFTMTIIIAACGSISPTGTSSTDVFEDTGMNFDAAVNDMQAASNNLSYYIDEAENLLSSTGQNELDNPGILEELQEQTESAKSLLVATIPEMADDAAQIKRQIENIRSQITTLEDKSFKLTNAIDSVNSGKQEFAERVAAEKKAALWKTITCEWTDSQGYSFEATMTISQWILQSDSEVLTETWEELNTRHTLPSLDEWGLQKYSGNEYTGFINGFPDNKTFYATMNDMYYAVGTVSIENKTDEWSFSDSNPGSATLILNWADSTITEFMRTRMISRVFYGSGTNTFGGSLTIAASMKSDRWGPVPFVIGYAENFSPNNPNGTFRSGVENGEFSISRPWNNTKLGTFSLEIYD